MGTQPTRSQVLLVIDMQQASFGRPEPVFDAEGLVTRINALARRVRTGGGRVAFIQFTGPEGTPFGSDQTGWELLDDLEVDAADLRLRKPGSDTFERTDVADIVGSPGDSELIVTGCDTEFCIDSTVRSALARGYRVTVPSDGHSLPDRPHLIAPQIIQHHNAIWATTGALAGSVTVCEASDVVV